MILAVLRLVLAPALQLLRHRGAAKFELQVFKMGFEGLCLRDGGRDILPDKCLAIVIE